MPALIVVSGLFLVLQVSATGYGMSVSGAGGLFWAVVGTILLWFVYRRRSRVARGFIIVLALFGAIVYAIGALDDAWVSAFLAFTFLGQALPLLTPPIRRHVTGT